MTQKRNVQLTLLLCGALGTLTACIHKNQTSAPYPPETHSAPTQTAPCATFFLMGTAPTTTRPVKLLCHSRMAIGFDSAQRLAAYSAEYLDATIQQGSARRESEFMPDPLLPPAEQVQSRAYTRSGYDRGHLAPAADFRGDQIAMRESFYTSNVAPQNRVLNREAWSGLENAVRACASRTPLFVLTGISPSASHLKAPPQLMIPSAFWKVISDGQHVRAFLFPNVDTTKRSSYRPFETPLNIIEQQTNLKLYPAGGPVPNQKLCKGYL